MAARFVFSSSFIFIWQSSEVHAIVAGMQVCARDVVQRNVSSKHRNAHTRRVAPLLLIPISLLAARQTSSLLPPSLVLSLTCAHAHIYLLALVAMTCEHYTRVNDLIKSAYNVAHAPICAHVSNATYVLMCTYTCTHTSQCAHMHLHKRIADGCRCIG